MNQTRTTIDPEEARAIVDPAVKLMIDRCSTTATLREPPGTASSAVWPFGRLGLNRTPGAR